MSLPWRRGCVPGRILVFLSVALTKACLFHQSRHCSSTATGTSQSPRNRRIVMLMYGHSRNQTGITLVSKALKEQGNRAVFINCSKEKNPIEAAALVSFFSPHKQHSLKRTKIRVGLIPVVNC